METRKKFWAPDGAQKKILSSKTVTFEAFKAHAPKSYLL